MAPLLTLKAREYLDRPDLDEGDDPQITDKQPIEDLDPNGKYVALTFDDGPHATVTTRILNTLSEHHAKATFFILGNQVKYYPKLVQSIEESRHDIAHQSN